MEDFPTLILIIVVLVIGIPAFLAMFDAFAPNPDGARRADDKGRSSSGGGDSGGHYGGYDTGSDGGGDGGGGGD